MAKRRYKDIDLRFESHPVTGDVSTTSDDAAIKQALKLLVLTDHYDIPFHPEIGSDVSATLFDLATPATAAILEKHIENTISNFEPRVTVLDISVETSSDMQGYDLTIAYRIKNEETVQTLVLPLERIR